MTANAIAPTGSRSFRSQYGEDIWICKYFDGKRDGFFIEAGAYDGVTFSNSLGLELLGWKGLLIEPIPIRFDECKRNRPGSITVNAALGGQDDENGILFWIAESGNGAAMLSSSHPDGSLKDRWQREGCNVQKASIPQRSITSLLSEFSIDKIDFVSLDLEGGEAEALRGFDLKKHRPLLLCVENAPPESESFRLLQEEGYQLIRTWHGNYFFAPVGYSAAQCAEPPLCQYD